MNGYSFPMLLSSRRFLAVAYVWPSCLHTRTLRWLNYHKTSCGLVGKHSFRNIFPFLTASVSDAEYSVLDSTVRADLFNEHQFWKNSVLNFKISPSWSLWATVPSVGGAKALLIDDHRKRSKSICYRGLNTHTYTPGVVHLQYTLCQSMRMWRQRGGDGCLPHLDQLHSVRLWQKEGVAAASTSAPLTIQVIKTTKAS